MADTRGSRLSAKRENGNSSEPRRPTKRGTKKTEQQIAEEGTTDSDDGPDEIPARPPLLAGRDMHHAMFDRNQPPETQLGRLKGRYFEANKYWEQMNGKLRGEVTRQKKYARATMLKKREMADELSTLQEGTDTGPAISEEQDGVQNGTVQESDLSGAGRNNYTFPNDHQDESVQSNLRGETGVASADQAVFEGSENGQDVEMRLDESDLSRAPQKGDGEGIEPPVSTLRNSTAAEPTQSGQLVERSEDIVDERQPNSPSCAAERELIFTTLDDALAEIERQKRIIREKDIRVAGEIKNGDYLRRRRDEEVQTRARVVLSKNEELRQLKHKFGERVDSCKCQQCTEIKQQEMEQRQEAYDRARAERDARRKEQRRQEVSQPNQTQLAASSPGYLPPSGHQSTVVQYLTMGNQPTAIHQQHQVVAGTPTTNGSISPNQFPHSANRSTPIPRLETLQAPPTFTLPSATQWSNGSPMLSRPLPNGYRTSSLAAEQPQHNPSSTPAPGRYRDRGDNQADAIDIEDD